MIEAVNGKVWGKREPNMVLILTGSGIVLGIHTTSRNLSGVQKGDSVSFYTHLRTRDDGMDLYGFSTENERNAFRVLLGINSVGPKTAVAILDKFTFGQLLVVAEQEDIDALCKVSGIGKKGAGRIILELSGKFISMKEKAKEPLSNAYTDAREGLSSMGYDSEFLDKRLIKLQKAEPGLSAEEIVKKVLKDG